MLSLVVATPPQNAFGAYTLVERIAVGGMAEVFLAVQSGLEGFEKRLALKRIRSHLSNEASFLRMFLDEAKLAAQLHHPNIVQILDLGRVDDAYYIAMEYIAGRDMARVLPRAESQGIQFPIEYALSIAASVLDGLTYAHTKVDALGSPLNIVHRDITPENIMIGWNGDVKILDFGIAKAASQSDQTRAGEIKGKLSYMSPEQARGKGLDARSDIFSLGVVLYEWVTGYKLFTGENEMAILRAILDGKIYPPSYFRDDLPEGLEAILMRALTKEPEARYQNASEMQFEILEFLRQQEFTPSNTHRANFMRQLFGPEIAREGLREREVAISKERTPAPNVAESSAQIGEAVGRIKTPPSSEAAAAALIVVDGPDAPGAASLRLSAEELAAAKSAADRTGQTVSALLEDVLRGTLKYL